MSLKENSHNHLLELVLFISLISLSITKLNPKKVVVAINCGGDEYTDKNGITYISDKYFNRGTASDMGMTYDIQGTEDGYLYQTERWSSSTLTYSIPLDNQPAGHTSIDGKYALVLKFSEVYFNHEGGKVFDVTLGKEKVIKNLDIYASVGKAHALDEFIEFEIRNGGVIHKGKPVKNGLDSAKQLQLSFVKGSADNPKINAILLIKGGLQETDYNENQKKGQEERKKKLSEARKREMLNLRHDSDELFNEEDLADEGTDAESLKKTTGLFSIYNSFLGRCIGGSLVLFGVLNYLIDWIKF